MKLKLETVSLSNIKKIIFGIAVLIIAISLIIIAENQKAVNQEIGKYLKEISVQIKEKVDNRINSNFTILNTVTEYVTEKKLTTEEVNDYMQYLKHSYPFEWIGYSDGAGNIVTSNGEKENIFNYSIIQRVLRGNEEISGEIIDIFGGKGILYGVPCNNDGAILGFVSQKTMASLLPVDSFDGEGIVHMINKNGEFIIKSSNKNSTIKGKNYFEELLKENLQTDKINKIIKDIQTGKDGNGRFEYNYTVYSVNYMLLKKTDWYILTLVPTSIYNTQMSNYTRYNLGIILAAIIIFIILVYFIKAIEVRNREITKIAYEDSVTKGFTSARFEIDVKEKLKKKEFEPFAFVSLDIRKFKLINESFGEDRGNFILKHVHDCIKKCLQKGESVSRISSDTFNILFDSTDKEEVKNKIRRISILINEINNEVERPYYLSIDCGVYMVDKKDLNIIVIRDRANHARKNSKNSKNGSNIDFFCNCIFYNNVETENSLREKNIEDNMEHALKNNEFVVYLQPKIELKTNKVAGAEALVRWQDPNKGLIPPNEFIPIFERNGFITKLDIYVFEEVCRTIKEWLDEGTNPIPISVNLSRVHLENPNFLKKYKEIQQKHGIPADLLEIELTETLVFENFENLKKVINEIHQMGFWCSVDDFGSGYSSLNLLKEIQVDTLKLDRIFFSKENDERGSSVIETIVGLAKKLNMETVSEGIETVSQVEFLKEINCDIVQGYVYSRPLSKKDFEASFLKNESVQVKKYIAKSQ